MYTIHLPPLRERGDDLELLVRHFLKRFGRELGKKITDVSPEAIRLLHDYSWPGNIRELQSVVKHSLLASDRAGAGPGVSARLRPQQSGPLASVGGNVGTRAPSHRKLRCCWKPAR